MKRSFGALVITETFLVVILLFLISAELFGFSWSKKVVMSSTQGDMINYTQGVKYTLNIYRLQRTLSSEFIILVSRKGDEEYGHYLKVPVDFSVSEKEAEKTRVMWVPDGIEMTFPSGHKLNIPKDKFIAGR